MGNAVGRLFDEFERTDARPRRHAESAFHFLNRASDNKWARVRDVLERYFAEYPAGEAGRDLRARFRNKKSSQHLAAWWELFVFSLYRRLGYELLPHPAVAGTTKRPDFLAVRSDSRIYIEALTVFPEIDDGVDSNDHLDAQLIDILDDAYNPDFMLGVEFLSHGNLLPRQPNLVGPVTEWLAELDADSILEEIQEGGEYPERIISVDAWRLALTAFPLSPEYRGMPGRLVGIPPGHGGQVTDEEAIRTAIRNKVNRYGNLDAPFVLAVMSDSPYTDDRTADHALFGSAVFAYRQGEVDSGRWIRDRNGIFMGRDGPRSTGVSAVLLATEVLPWTHARAELRLWTNPWATNSIEGADGLSSGTVSLEGASSMSAGTLSVSQLFGLSSDWPSEPS